MTYGVILAQRITGEMNNEERRLWVLNDEELYTWFKGTHLSMTEFLKENREELDKCIPSR